MSYLQKKSCYFCIVFFRGYNNMQILQQLSIWQFLNYIYIRIFISMRVTSSTKNSYLWRKGLQFVDDWFTKFMYFISQLLICPLFCSQFLYLRSFDF